MTLSRNRIAARDGCLPMRGWSYGLGDVVQHLRMIAASRLYETFIASLRQARRARGARERQLPPVRLSVLREASTQCGNATCASLRRACGTAPKPRGKPFHASIEPGSASAPAI